MAGDHQPEPEHRALYGAVNPRDGCWHDPETGELPEGSIGGEPWEV